MTFRNLLVSLVDQTEDYFTNFARVRPLFHFKRIFHLHAPDLKEFDLAIGIIELNWVRDLGVLRIWELLSLLKLLEVCVKDVSQILVLFLAMELETELEEMLRNFVVQMEQFTVLSESIHDDLGYIGEEVDLRDDLQLLGDLFDVAIG